MFKQLCIYSITFNLLCAFCASLPAAEPGIADYRVVADWPRLPANVKLGAVSAVAADSAGNIYVFHRGQHPLLVFTRDGDFVRSWGDDLIRTAHGLRIDRDDHLWITDIGHHQVRKFARSGELLLTLGKQDSPGDGRDQFNKPTDIAFAANGDFYVSDGYGNSRVVQFSKEGKYLREWGQKGTGPGEFNLPHSICVDRQGRVIVGDRENDRIQVFTPEGKFLTQWKEGGAPFGLFLTPKEQLFVADGRANWVKVIDLLGKPLGRFGSKGTGPGQFELPHMLCVDNQGAVYVAEVNGKRVQKFVGK
jgi:DNA-binding beta-propeller fold protein YncE